MAVPVAARSKAWVCSSALVEIVGSNPTGGMDVCLLWVLCVVRQKSLRRGDHSSREESHRQWCVFECDLETSWMRRPWPTGPVAPKTNKQTNTYYGSQPKYYACQFNNRIYELRWSLLERRKFYIEPKEKYILSDVIMEGFTSIRKTELKTSYAYRSKRLQTWKAIILYRHFICYLMRSID
jgi:hypothetical protein